MHNGRGVWLWAWAGIGGGLCLGEVKIQLGYLCGDLFKGSINGLEFYWQKMKNY